MFSGFYLGFISGFFVAVFTILAYCIVGNYFYIKGVEDGKKHKN
jgi:hypothetical protein